MADFGETGPHDDFEAQRLLALHFALGLLEGDARERAIGLYESSAAFAAQVADHEERLFSMSEPAPPAAGANDPSWTRIAAMLSSAPANKTNVPVAANDDRHVPRRAIAMTAVATALLCLTAGSLLWLLDLMPGRGPMQDSGKAMIAQISTDKDPIIAIAYDRGLGQLTARYLPPVAKGQVPELWLIGRDGKPQSLGFAESGKSITITIPAELRGALMDGAVIAVSLEKPSTVRRSTPAGPILGTAKFSAI